MKPSLTAFRQAHKLGLALLISQIIMSLVILPYAGSADMFPYFQWNLFSEKTKTGAEPLLFLHSIGNQSFDKPITIHQYIRTLNPDIKYPKIVSVHDALWSYQRATNLDQRRLLQRKIESILFPNTEATYTIRMVELDRLSFYRDFSFIKESWSSEILSTGED